MLLCYISRCHPNTLGQLPETYPFQDVASQCLPRWNPPGWQHQQSNQVPALCLPFWSQFYGPCTAWTSQGRTERKEWSWKVQYSTLQNVTAPPSEKAAQLQGLFIHGAKVSQVLGPPKQMGWICCSHLGGVTQLSRRYFILNTTVPLPELWVIRGYMHLSVWT